jgi:hypothetical protein
VATPKKNGTKMPPHSGGVITMPGGPSWPVPVKRRPPGANKVKTPSVPGRRLIKQSGGNARDVADWRKLPQARRDAIKRRVLTKGGSLTATVRRISPSPKKSPPKVGK